MLTGREGKKGCKLKWYQKMEKGLPYNFLKIIVQIYSLHYTA